LSAASGGDERLRERLRAERDERRRLAELVHDGPVQHLAALGHILDAAGLAFDAGDVDDARGLVTRAQEIAREAAGDLRDLVAGFEPETLHEDGFDAAVRELFERAGARRGISVELDLPAAALLGEGARSGLYQIAREALDQAIRRGPPQHLSLTLVQTPVGGVVLSLTDDGAVARRQAVRDGLSVRPDDLNATFGYERAGTATTITVTLPPSAAYV
jgi:two-component system NarL family sensor kinase